VAELGLKPLKHNCFILLDDIRSEVIARCIEEDTEVNVVNDVIQREVEDAYTNIQKYLATLNPLRDFWYDSKRIYERTRRVQHLLDIYTS